MALDPSALPLAKEYTYFGPRARDEGFGVRLTLLPCDIAIPFEL
jgi:hypothetical protein